MGYQCPITSKRFAGLAIELKTGKGTLTTDELVVLRNMLRKQRYLVAVCFGYEACKKVFMAYRANKPLNTVEALCWAGRIRKENVIPNVFCI